VNEGENFASNTKCGETHCPCDFQQIAVCANEMPRSRKMIRPLQSCCQLKRIGSAQFVCTQETFRMLAQIVRRLNFIPPGSQI
jgi:hypothetical protein